MYRFCLNYFLIVIFCALYACSDNSNQEQTKDSSTIDITCDAVALDQSVQIDTAIPDNDVSVEDQTVLDQTILIDTSSPTYDAKPTPSCKPYCGAIGSKSEGWFDGCTNQFLTDPTTGSPLWDNCATCDALCKNCGGGCPTNGWYSDCNQKFLKTDQSCVECRPKCEQIGSLIEGWYDSCTGHILLDPVTGSSLFETCGSCVAACKFFGTSQNGYYNSCNNQLIKTATCIQ